MEFTGYDFNFDDFTNDDFTDIIPIISDSKLSDEENEKYIYCPDYDSFLIAIKPKLTKRINNHLEPREEAIIEAVNKTITRISQLGLNFNIHPTFITQYNKTFINKNFIQQLIEEWKGPKISTDYKRKFDEGKVGFIDQSKFDKDSINWLDQSSYKVSGDNFFAKHIQYTKEHLRKYCEFILNIDESKRINIINYASIYFAVELLEKEIKFCRSKKQPLIRHKTLVNSVGIHKAFKFLYNSLDLIGFKKSTKKDLKQKNKNKYRVNSKQFYQDIRKYCLFLLNKECINLGLQSNISNYRILPTYFKQFECNNCNHQNKSQQLLPNNSNINPNYNTFYNAYNSGNNYRYFQNSNTYIQPQNRIHLNMKPIVNNNHNNNNNYYPRYNRIEKHISNMRDNNNNNNNNNNNSMHIMPSISPMPIYPQISEDTNSISITPSFPTFSSNFFTPFDGLYTPSVFDSSQSKSYNII